MVETEIPQGLKPDFTIAACGTAEAVPFQGERHRPHRLWISS